MQLTSSVRCFFAACMIVQLKVLIGFPWLCSVSCAVLLVASKLCLVTQDSRERISQEQVQVQAALSEY
jgi:type III secretory pathway component EscV